MNRKAALLPDGAFTGGSVDRLQGLDELIPDLSGHNILDVGAGPGIVAEYLLSRFLCGVTLIEGHEPSVLKAKRALARFGDRAVVLHQNCGGARQYGDTPVRHNTLSRDLPSRPRAMSEIGCQASRLGL